MAREKTLCCALVGLVLASCQANFDYDFGDPDGGDGSVSSDVNEGDCGNGFVEAGEACDDGNNTSGDGCSSSCQHEASTELQCDDGIDNDGDGLVDCSDADCEGDSVCISAGEICDDGIDNDGDSFTDCDDNDCATDPACTAEICDDTVDNDGDGLVDCDDPDCAGTPSCP